MRATPSPPIASGGIGSSGGSQPSSWIDEMLSSFREWLLDLDLPERSPPDPNGPPPPEPDEQSLNLTVALTADKIELWARGGSLPSIYAHEIVEYLKEFVVKERRELFEAKIKERTQHLTIVLENIFQGRNISASIRSADCFGIQDVHIIENDNFFNDDSEVSMGAEKWITTKKKGQAKGVTLSNPG